MHVTMETNDSQAVNITSLVDEIVIFYPRGATIFAAACSIIFIFVGVIGNFLTMVALTRYMKSTDNKTTAFVLSLCVSDLLFCAFNLPMIASRYINEAWVLGDLLCELFPLFFYGNVAASLLSIMAITINRYILISHNRFYEKVYRPRYIALMITFIWMFSFGILIPSFMGKWGRLGLDPPTFSCTILRKDGKSPKKFLFLFGFLLPCIVILVCYSCILYFVRKSRRNVQAHRSIGVTPTKPPKSPKKDEERLTRMIVIIFVCFILCFLPLMIVNVADDHVVVPTLHVMASVLAWAASVVNPFIYAASNRQYRKAYRKLFEACFRGGKPRARPDHSMSIKTFTTEMHYNAPMGKLIYNDKRASPPEED